MNITKALIMLLLSIIVLSCATTQMDEIVEIIPEKSLYEINIMNAENGNLDAQVKVGISFEEGQGVSINYDEAYKWYRLAASKGNNEAYYRIGRFYELGYSVEKNWIDAHEWFLSSAITGYVPAIIKLIKFYENDKTEQNKWIELGVKSMDPYSFYRMALNIEESDPEIALEYFRKTVDLEDVEAKGTLSIISLGLDYPFYSEDDSIHNIISAAKSGNIRCQVFLGWLYEFGYKVDQNYAKAFELYESAAEHSEYLALYNLSRFYGEGIYVEADSLLANKYFNQIPEFYYSQVLNDLLKFAQKRAFVNQQLILYRFEAVNNDLNAFYQLGMLSESSEATQWFWLAAEAGHVPSMIELAESYLDNDIIRAAAWLMMAENISGIEHKSLSSAVLLEEMDDKEKLEVSKLFTEMFYSDEKIIENKTYLRKYDSFSEFF